MVSIWIQQPSTLLVAENANFIFSSFVIFSFSKHENVKRSISIQILKMDEEDMFPSFEFQKSSREMMGKNESCSVMRIFLK